MQNAALFTALLLLLAAPARGADVWLLQAAADGWSDGCRTQSWGGDAVFHNSADAPATVRLLGVSGGLFLDPTVSRSFDVPAHRTVTLQQMTRGLWRAPSWMDIWVTHLDVPEGVLVEGRINVGVNDYCSLFPIVRTPSLGKLSQPAIRSLTPAGKPHIHAGTDLGLVDSRTNVALYNAGDSITFASIELRRACDDALLATQTAAVLPNGFVQVGLIAQNPNADACVDAPGYVRYTVIRMDQPGVSWVSMVAAKAPGTDPPLVSVPINVNITQ